GAGTTVARRVNRSARGSSPRPQPPGREAPTVGAGCEDDLMSDHEPAAEEAQPALIPELAQAREAARSAQRRGATARKKAAAKPAVEPAEVDPVAQVLVDVPLAHLDRPFDYLVPATMADAAVPGARVKVRFAGQDVDGFVLAR